MPLADHGPPGTQSFGRSHPCGTDLAPCGLGDAQPTGSAFADDWVTITALAQEHGPHIGLDEADQNLLIAFYLLVPNIVRMILGVPVVQDLVTAEWRTLTKVAAQETADDKISPEIVAMLGGNDPRTIKQALQAIVQKAATAMEAAGKAALSPEQRAAEKARLDAYAARLQQAKPQGAVSTKSFQTAVAKLDARTGTPWWQNAGMAALAIVVLWFVFRGKK